LRAVLAWGKSALATKIAFGAAKSLLEQAREEGPDVQPKKAGGDLLAGNERGTARHEIAERESRISGDRIRRGDIGQRDFDKFVEVSREIGSLPLQIDDTAAISMSMLRTRCRRLQRTKGLAMVVVDYLQFDAPFGGDAARKSVLEISQITQGLKAAGKGTRNPRARLVAIVAGRSRAARTSGRSFRIFASPARSNRTPTW